MKKRINLLKNIILIISILIYSYLIFIGRNQYIFHMTYKKCIIYILLITIFIYLYGITKNNNQTYKNNINTYILLYLILLISITFFIGRDTIKIYNWWYTGQYKPFYTIISQLKYASNQSILKNIIGNSIMLIPLSLLLMIKSKKYNSILSQLIIILPTIVIIELFQAFTHTGIFDIDDIILNYLGTIIFTFIITKFSIIDKIRNLFYTDYKLDYKIKLTAFYIILIILNIYIISLLT